MLRLPPLRPGPPLLVLLTLPPPHLPVTRWARRPSVTETGWGVVALRCDRQQGLLLRDYWEGTPVLEH